MASTRRVHATSRWLRGGLALIGLAFAPLVWALDLNTADRAQLEQLPRVGVARAEVILQERERHGPFASWDDFRRRVPGYGEKTVQQLKDRGVTIGPAAANATQ